MELDLRQDIAIVTVIGVESFPCSMLGQKKVFTMKGEGQSGNLKLPWNLPMTWLEKQLTELIRRDMPNEMFIVTELINQLKFRTPQSPFDSIYSKPSFNKVTPIVNV